MRNDMPAHIRVVKCSRAGQLTEQFGWEMFQCPAALRATLGEAEQVVDGSAEHRLALQP